MGDDTIQDKKAARKILQKLETISPLQLGAQTKGHAALSFSCCHTPSDSLADPLFNHCPLPVQPAASPQGLCSQQLLLPSLIAWQLPCFTPASPRIISCLLALRCEQKQMEFLWNSLEQQWLSKHWHTGYPSAVLPLVRAPAACAQGSCHWPCRTCCLTTKLNQLNSSMQPSCPSISEPIDLNI